MNIRNLPQWNLCSIRSCYENIGYICRIAAELRCVTYTHRETLPPFDGGSEIVFTDSCLDDVLDLANINAVTRSSLAVRRDIQVQTACDLLWIDIARALHGPYNLRYFTGLCFE